MDDNISTIRDFLEICFPGHAVKMKRFEDQLNHALGKICEAVEQLQSMSPVPGYEPFLVERGQHPLVARVMSLAVFVLSAQATDEAKMRPIVADALRFLAEPGRRKCAISRRATVLLQAGKTGSHLGEIFHGHDLSVLEFIDLLDRAVRGDQIASQRVGEVAAALAPQLTVSRGPKAKRASVAHDLFLGLAPGSYTWDDVKGDFSDPQTYATRSAFNDPDFDPRPALRRRKERLRLKSN